MELTSTHLRYLYTIFEIGKETPAISSRTIAERMHVSRPSVARMLSILMERKLIVKELYGKVYLTDSGFLLARRFDSTVSLLAQRLPRTGLPFTPEELHEAACALAAALPEKHWQK